MLNLLGSLIEDGKIEAQQFISYCLNIPKDRLDIELGLMMRSGHLEVTNYSSDLKLDDFFKIIKLSEIEFIEIKINKNDSDNVTFFYVEITTKYGLFIFNTEWCLWKGSRLDELVRGLLIPLYLANLQDKVMFDGTAILYQKPELVLSDLIAAAKDHLPEQFKGEMDKNLDKNEANILMAETISQPTEKDLDEILKKNLIASLYDKRLSFYINECL